MRAVQCLTIFGLIFLMSCGSDGSDSTDVPVADSAADVALDAMEVAVQDSAPEVVPEAVDDMSVDLPPRTTPGGLPMELPFALERADEGEPLTPEEITAFTRRITGLWLQVDYFTWVYETSHGVDDSTGYPDYLIWWHDVDAVKAGDTVTFMNQPAYGGSHNNAEPTNLVLVQALGSYLAIGDESAGEIVEQFANSNTALMKGFVFDDNDPLDMLLARNIVTFNHEFTLPSGKKKVVEYDKWYSAYEGWNADRFNYPNNPTWGDVWVTNMRSKDDVPYIYRAAAWLPYVIELSPEGEAKEAAVEMLDFTRRFAKDVVDSGWNIRTKDAAGNAYIVEDQDLLSLNDYVEVMEDAECPARLATAYLGYGDNQGVDCGKGYGSLYEELAGSINYFNYQIIDHFHVAAAHLALTYGDVTAAEQLMIGLGERMDLYLAPDSKLAGKSDVNWGRDISLIALKSAALGLPLTSKEVRLIHKYHDGAVDRYTDFPNWDLWDPSVPDGAYSFRDGFHPKSEGDAVRCEEMAFLMEYCWSPFRNPAGRQIVDCDIVNDPMQWGQ